MPPIEPDRNDEDVDDETGEFAPEWYPLPPGLIDEDEDEDEDVEDPDG